MAEKEQRITLMSTEQAAEYLNLSRATLERNRMIGEPPVFVKFSRSVRYRLQDLNDLIEKRIRKSTSDTGNK